MARIKVGCPHEHCATIGGGTVHLFKFLEWLSPYYDVDIIFPNTNIPTDKWYKENMDIDLSKTNKITLDKANLHDYEIWINGWASKIIDNPHAKTKINLVWFPFLKGLASQAQSFINVGNSKYTEKHIRKIWGVKKENSTYIYPPTSLGRFKSAKTKKNWIIHVSRFMYPDPASDKGHVQMINTFKKMVDEGLKGWEFHLAGMLLKDREKVMEYYTGLLELAQGYPIYFHTNVTMDKMVELQSISKIYWHATGISLKNPAAQEHFGLTTCCKPNTLIETNYGISEIQNIKVGDIVRTHTGRWKRVVEIKKRKVQEKLYKIHKTELTKEHPVLIIRPTHLQKETILKHFKGYKHRWVCVKDLRVGDWTLYPKDNHINGDITLNTIDIAKYLDGKKHMKKSDTKMWYSVGHNNKTRHFINRMIPLNKDTGRLLGYYVAEGSMMGGCRNRNGVSFSFGTHEMGYRKDVITLISHIFGTKKIAERIRKNRTEILCGSKILGELFHGWFGTTASHKKLPVFVENAPREFLVGLITGYIRGDGYCPVGDKNSNSVSVTTASKNLAFQIKRLLSGLDIVSSATESNRITTFPGYKKETTIYTIRIGGESAKLLREYLGVEYRPNEMRKTYDKSLQDEKYIYKRINKIDKTDYTGVVFNLEVDDDESYVTSDFTVHNCEAIAAGAVPVTYNSGGQPEIVTDGDNGFLYNNLDMLKSKTMKLVGSPKLLKEMRDKGKKTVRKFSEDKSKKAWLNFISRTNKVSIVIGTTHNTLLFKKCIASLIQKTPPGYELIIIDNAAGVETKEFIKTIKYRPLKIITNKKVKGFSEFNNQGIKISTRPYICCLNDDTEPDYYWLEAMIDLMEDDPKVGVAGAKLLFPNGTIQHDGKKYSPDGIPYHVNHHKPDDGNWKSSEVEAVTGACMLIRKELAKFNEKYIKGYFEDDQLQLDARRKGYKVMIARKAPIIHHEGSSMSKNVKETEDIYHRNRGLFLKKNKQYISKLLSGVDTEKTEQPLGNGLIVNLNALDPDMARSKVQDTFDKMGRDERLVLTAVNFDEACRNWLRTFDSKYVAQIFGNNNRWGWSFQKAYELLMGVGFKDVSAYTVANQPEGYFSISGIKP